MKTLKKFMMLSLMLSFIFANLANLKNIKFPVNNGDTGIQTLVLDPSIEPDDILY